MIPADDESEVSGEGPDNHRGNRRLPTTPYLGPYLHGGEVKWWLSRTRTPQPQIMAKW
jgi:hypothetical protein